MPHLVPLCMAFYCLGILTVSLPTTIALIAEALFRPSSDHPAQPHTPRQQQPRPNTFPHRSYPPNLKT